MKLLKNKVITLIEMVITIVLILIMAGVTINSLSGSDSIIEGAKREKKRKEGLIENEEKQINGLYDELQATD